MLRAAFLLAFFGSLIQVVILEFYRSSDKIILKVTGLVRIQIFQERSGQVTGNEVGRLPPGYLPTVMAGLTLCPRSWFGCRPARWQRTGPWRRLAAQPDRLIDETMAAEAVGASPRSLWWFRVDADVDIQRPASAANAR